MKRIRNPESKLISPQHENTNRLDTASHQTKPEAPFTLAAFFRERFHVDCDPADLVYKQRYTTEVVDSFRVLSLLVFATMTFLFLLHLVQIEAFKTQFPGALSVTTCAVLTAAGGVSLLISKFIRSPAAAVIASAALLVSCSAALTIDRLR